MGPSLLGDILANWSAHELDDSIYLPAGSEPSLGQKVNVLPFDPLRKRIFEGQHYWLGIEQVRDVVEGLQHQLQREATPDERLKAAAHYARFDAFIDPKDL
jgi:hypothetical protein